MFQTSEKLPTDVEEPISSGDNFDVSLEGSSEDISSPDGGYGWICVIAVFLMNAHTWGISTSYSVFLAYYRETSSLVGATTLSYAFIGGIEFGTPFVVAPIATKVIGRFGLRACVLIGLLLQCGSLLGASWASNIWHLFLGQGLGFGLGVGFINTASLTLIPQWFVRRRGLAMGLAAAGTGAGGMLYSLLAGQMIEQLGVEWAIRILAIIAGAVNLVCALLIKSRDQCMRANYNFFRVKLLQNPRFGLLVGFSFFSMLGEIIILTEVADYGTSVLGIDTTQSSVIGAMVALGQICGRTSIGWASDRYGKLNAASTVTSLAGLWCLIFWTTAGTFGQLVFFSLCIGAFAGAFWSVISPVTAEVMGLDELPDSLSLLFLCLVIPTTFSPVIAMGIVTSTDGGYLGAQLFSGFAFMIAAGFSWVLRSLKLKEDKIQGEEETSQPASSIGPLRALYMRGVV